MTNIERNYQMSGRGFIAHEPDSVCDLCGSIAECRPYGPNGEQVCFSCGTGTPEARAITEKRMASYLFGDSDS